LAIILSSVFTIDNGRVPSGVKYSPTPFVRARRFFGETNQGAEVEVVLSFLRNVTISLEQKIVSIIT
jgi:uncharacterized circularly permuted ATP-grasp superfamily protein